jgi:hypothetical protein
VKPGDLRVWLPPGDISGTIDPRFAGKTLLVVWLFGPSGAPHDPLYVEHITGGVSGWDVAEWVERESQRVESTA